MSESSDPFRAVERALERLQPVAPPGELRAKTLAKLQTPAHDARPRRRSLFAWLDQLSVTAAATACASMLCAAVFSLWAIEQDMDRLLGPPDEIVRAHQFTRLVGPAIDQSSVAHVQRYVERLLWRNPLDRSKRGQRTYEMLREMELRLADGEFIDVEKDRKDRPGNSDGAAAGCRLHHLAVVLAVQEFYC